MRTSATLYKGTYRPTMYQQMISLIGKLNHRILTAQVTSNSSRHLCFPLSNFKVQTVDYIHTSSTCYQSARRTTSACVYSTYSYVYTISYTRLLSKLTPSYAHVIESHGTDGIFVYQCSHWARALCLLGF